MAGGKFANSGKRKPDKLNITSLMDALTIILIFLLVNYSDVTEENDLPKFIEMPSLEGKVSKAKIGIKVIIGERFIQVGPDRKIEFNDFENEQNQVLVQVKDELQLFKKEKAQRIVASEVDEGDEKKEEPIKVSIHADKAVHYKVINAVVNSAAELSLNFIDFVALNKSE